MALIEYDDLLPFAPTLGEAKAEAMIADAVAMATLVAPCITEPGFTQGAVVKAILRGAILRWVDAGSGALVSRTETVGPFSQAETLDSRQGRRVMFVPSEITALQGVCRGGAGGRAYTIIPGGDGDASPGPGPLWW